MFTIASVFVCFVLQTETHLIFTIASVFLCVVLQSEKHLISTIASVPVIGFITEV